MQILWCLKVYFETNYAVQKHTFKNMRDFLEAAPYNEWQHIKN